MPAVSCTKAKGAYDGHPGYSDPLDEQQFIVKTINTIEASPFWNETAIIIAYDDSDGWYDHVMDPLVNRSQLADHNLTGTGLCGSNAAVTTQGGCGYGPRTPLLVVSPYARQNFVDPPDHGSVLDSELH
jgi:phospholipase C